MPALITGHLGCFQLLAMINNATMSWETLTVLSHLVAAAMNKNPLVSVLGDQDRCLL